MTEIPEAAEPISDTVGAFISSRAALSKGASVVFEDLSVEGWGKGIQPAPTILSALRSWFDLVNPAAYTQKAPWRVLLHPLSGAVARGEMLLVIGKPGSGCTTFLKSMANMRGEYKNTTGKLLYDGQEASKGSHAFPTFCQAEEDSHLPTLTVAETFRFAIKSTWDARASDQTIEGAVQTLARCMGLEHVLDTKVGDAAIRGVSGGERRRVSLGEAMATCPDVLCLDNPTNGLDSSTALEFVELARAFTRQQGCATAMSLYQGSNAMVPLFDKVLVLHTGRQIFYGPAAEAKAYFEALGFVCPERCTVTDFLNAMTAEPQLRHVRPGWEHRVPRTADQFAEAFRGSPHHQRLLTAVAAAAAERAGADARTPPSPVFALPLHQQVWTCAVRQMRVVVRDYQTWLVEAACYVVQSVLLGTAFRALPRATGAFFRLESSQFLMLLMPALQSMNEFGNTFAQRPLVMRQGRGGYRFYRPVSYALAMVLTDVPWKVLAIAYNIPQYFLSGFQRDAGRFFAWFVTAYMEHMALAMIFRTIAVFSPSVHKATLPVGFFITAMIVYTGLYIPPRQMQVWLSWLRYLNPMYYAYESAMVNEFGNLDYRCSDADLAPSGSGYSISHQVCAVPGATAGSSLVSGRAFVKAQFGFEVSHLWRNLGINIAFFVAFSIFTAIGMERYKVPAGRLATIFYKGGRKDFAKSEAASGSDSEKGHSDDKTVPGSGTMLQNTVSHSVGAHSGRTLVWKHVSFEVKLKDGPRKLLDDISGCVKPGQLTALMGMSGAGKSTLLNALAGRVDFGKLSGCLFLDGKPLPKSFRRTMGYVQQQDVHLPTQTVREALQMTARLRRPQSVPRADKDAYVEEVMRILEMEDLADALIGVPGAGMNLEQRKRVTIGVELSARPDILFLDEPTSGLDGQSAVQVVRLLQKLAASGQTVLCTIHQPAAEVIESFDQLILLVRGGQLAYAGPFGHRCATALDYFARHSRPCRPDENPAEFLLEVVGAGARQAAAADWAAVWRCSRESEGHGQADVETTDSESASPLDGSTYATSFFCQLAVVLRRTWLFSWREPDYFVSKLLLSVGHGLINGLTYLQASDSQQGVYNRVFSLFVAIIVGPPLGLMVIPRFAALRDLFLLRERDAATYRWPVFVLAAVAVELPLALLTSLVYFLLWYFSVGYFYAPARAGYALLLYLLFGVFSTSLAQLCAALMPTVGGAFAANGFFWAFVNTFAGTLVPQTTAPAGWRWYFRVSPLYYFAEGMATSALQGLPIRCRADELSVFQPPDGRTCAAYAADFLQEATGYLVNPASVADCAYCRYRDGQAYYTQYGYDFVHRYKNVGIFIGFIAFNYTAVSVLTYLIYIKRWRK